ncbi:hypothetical protein P7K49_022676 [Saguinus oedipus]|uniref:Uncharacterized protein n=1 Tax=Saguinus oedipus TaxID=9490 RepID=A0ABQ9UKC1_SAGOE|nr:hypothetical protein P7K49_022676 [Saguinus oedipus]
MSSQPDGPATQLPPVSRSRADHGPSQRQGGHRGQEAGPIQNPPAPRHRVGHTPRATPQAVQLL